MEWYLYGLDDNLLNYDPIKLVNFYIVIHRNNILNAVVTSNHISIFIGSAYMFIWLTLSNYILLNLFLAVLLDSMRDCNDEENKEIIEDIGKVIFLFLNSKDVEIAPN